ncbi:hypothetical protein [Erythrobacter sp. WG]|uniref:hypothetical protein n=1 Tax=Erythrobacter sp. WG TaxID=2985510 RepID=UPI002270777B|nr:hypothetical protein [Erythrobacter sp. WG]MCX9147285.1 hypothetical protein [Erythrobacter sp. WG]
MTDRDPMSHNKDMRQDRRDDGLNNQSERANRANQQAASRPPVDAEHSLDERGHMTADDHEGRAFQPMERRLGADRRQSDGDYVIDQGAAARSGDQHITSRQRGVTQHGDAIRESQSAPGGGSVFQPLAADPSHREDEGAKQGGNPAGQNQQGLNPGNPIGQGEDRQTQAQGRAPRLDPRGPGEPIRLRDAEDEPRGYPGERGSYRP